MFSVIIPYYNKEKYIERCIASVSNQTFQDFEIILVDDGSNDNGCEIIKAQYANKITLISQTNQGVSAARNAGIKVAKYPFVAFLDADDCWHKQFLEKVKTVIDTEEDVKIIGTHYSRSKDFLSKKQESINYLQFENYFKLALRNTYFTSSSVVISKSFFDNNSAFNSILKRGEDIDVWIRVVQSGGNAFYITDTLSYYSDEDVFQATNTKHDLQQTLVGKINELYSSLKIESKNVDFNKFVSIYVYFNLYPYYYDTKYHESAKKALYSNEFKYYLLHLPYLMPLSIGKRILNSKVLKKQLRLYLKFIIRYALK
jgi:glycosyltransferase involved in cell wall biosynthesis